MTKSCIELIMRKLNINWYNIEDHTVNDRTDVLPAPCVIIELPKYRYLFKRKRLKKMIEDIRPAGVLIFLNTIY